MISSLARMGSIAESGDAHTISLQWLCCGVLQALRRSIMSMC